MRIERWMRGIVIGIGLMVVWGNLALAQEVKLLTENGLTNPKHSYYKKKSHYLTNGTYLAKPGFQETNYKEKELSFKEGKLTNGDFTNVFTRKPGPYTYWNGMKSGEVIFDFKDIYTVNKISVSVLNKSPHGTKSLTFSKSMDGKDFQLFSKIEETVNKWNEVDDIQEDLRYLKIRFELAPGKKLITCSEVEVWGYPDGSSIVKTNKKGDAAIIISKDAPEVVKFAAKNKTPAK